MRLLIAGWQGQVARALAEIAPKAADVAALALGRSALDVRDPRSVARAIADIQPDVVVNSAAFTGVDKAESEPDAAFHLNRDGARVLAEAAARRGAAIIHISTDYVFDGAKDTAYVEDDPTGPVNVYGLSRLAGEVAVMAANPRHVVLRASWIFGPYRPSFPATILERARLATGSGGAIDVVADQFGTPTYAPHLATAILDIARRIVAPTAASPWGIYHAAGQGGPVSWSALATEVMAASARHGGPVAAIRPIAGADYPSVARRLANGALDCGKLARTFGMTLPRWQDGVAACVPRLTALPDRPS